ncbi:MAG TPA: hypothetical protein VGH08_11065 [Chthoniobacterales bacterium]
MNKEHTKKIILGGIGLIVLLYVYFSFFLGPLNRTRYSMAAKLGDLQNKVMSSKEEIAKTAKLEESARAATARYNALRTLTPDGAPIAWFPPRIKAFLVSQRIDKSSTRLETTTGFPEKELAAWNRYTWIVDLPQADFQTLGRALASLENSEPLLSITRLHIHAMTEDPDLQQVSLTASTIIGKK